MHEYLCELLCVLTVSQRPKTLNPWTRVRGTSEPPLSRFGEPNSHLLEQWSSIFLILQPFNTFPQVVVTLNHNSNVATVMEHNVNNYGNRGLPKELQTTGWEPLT